MKVDFIDLVGVEDGCVVIGRTDANNKRERLPLEPNQENDAKRLKPLAKQESRSFCGCHGLRACNLVQEEDEVEDEEVNVVGSIGENALADYPHAREDCVSNPMHSDPHGKHHCELCYCKECDVVASECLAWSSHFKRCKDRWELQQEKRGLKQRPTLRRSTTSRTSGNNNLGRVTSAFSPSFSLSEALRQVGTICWWKEKGSYGMVMGKEDRVYFCHRDQFVTRCPSVEVGQKVSFEAMGEKCINVRLQ